MSILEANGLKQKNILRKKKEYGVIKFHLQISGTKSRTSEKFHWHGYGWNNNINPSMVRLCTRKEKHVN